MIFLRRLWLFVAVAVLVFSAVILLTMQQTPVYEAEASVLIEPRKTGVVDIASVVSGLPADTNTIDTEVLILGARSTAEEVVRRLGLQLDPEFVGSAAVVDGAKRKGSAPLGQTSEAMVDTAVDAVLKVLTVRREGNTYIINVTAKSPNPEKAARIANTFIEAYFAKQLAVKNNANRDAGEWLNMRMTELRSEAESADGAVQRYKIANGLMSAQGSTMAEQEVSTLNQQIAAANQGLAEKEAQLSAARTQMQRGGAGADIGGVLGSNTISTLRAQEAMATQQLADLTTRYGPLYPDVQKSRNQLAAIQSQLQSETTRIISSLEAQVDVARQGLNSLSRSQNRARGSLASNNSAQVGLMELERRAEANRAVYEAFLNRSKETTAQEGLQQADARVLARAQVPAWPVSPNVPLAGMFGLAAGLALGFIAIAIAEYLDSSIQTGTDVESKFGVRYAGAVPTLKSTLKKGGKNKLPYDYLVDQPFSAFSESLRSLRTFLLFPATGEKPRVIVLSSALPREGKSVTSMCLARTIAMAGSKVVLIDCDMRRHGLTDISGVTGTPDIGLVLAGEATLEQAIYKDSKTEARIIGAVTPSTDHRDLFSTPAFDALLEDLKAEYEVVLIDTAPVLAVAETRVIAAKADAVLMLAHWRKTPFKATDSAIDLLLEAGCNLVGLALTQVNLKQQAATGYGDRYYYYKAYAKYYTTTS